MNDMVPPALPEVRQDVLEAQLDHLIQQVPKMEQVEVSDDEGAQNPVATMH
jgi:hypothetical protein